MAKRRDLIITIDADGNVQIQVEGVTGSSCVEMTKWLEDELGDVTDREFTSEYYQQDQETEEDVSVGNS